MLRTISVHDLIIITVDMPTKIEFCKDKIIK